MGSSSVLLRCPAALGLRGEWSSVLLPASRHPVYFEEACSTWATAAELATAWDLAETALGAAAAFVAAFEAADAATSSSSNSRLRKHCPAACEHLGHAGATWLAEAAEVATALSVAAVAVEATTGRFVQQLLTLVGTRERSSWRWTSAGSGCYA